MRELRRRSLGIAQNGRVLDESPKLSTTARRRCSIDDVVVDCHGEIKHVADLDLAPDDSWACRHPSHDDLE